MKYNIDNNRKKEKRSWRNNPVILSLCLIILFFSTRAAWQVYLNVKESSKAATEKQNELSQLEEREKFLNQQFKNMSTVDGREAALREKFGVGRPGENVAIIVESGDQNNSSSTLGFWQSIKNLFK